MANNSYSVYKHETPNGKIYIGITCQNPTKRWGNGCNYRNQKYLYAAIKKYGWENIKHEVLYTGLSKEDAEQKEIELIAFYKSNDRKFGYNIDNGGKSKGRCSEETKRRISAVQKGKKQSPYTIQKRIESRKGYRHSPETIKKISESNKKVKRIITAEQREKMTNGAKNFIYTDEMKKIISDKIKRSWTPERRKAMSDRQRGSKCRFYGKKFSEAEIKHLQEINRGANSVLSKRVGQFDLDGNLIYIFGSAREAGRNGFTTQGVTGVCRGIRHTHKGYIWKYIGE